MTSDELHLLKQLLMEKRKALYGEMNSIRAEESELSLKEEDGDHSAYAFHLADQGTDSMIQEQNFFYAERDSRLLYHIDQALERMEDGTYGQCEECGGDIGFDRLAALPHARLCIRCKAIEEGGETNGYYSTDAFEVQDDEFDEMY